MQTKIQEITETLKDFRVNEIPRITELKVRQWVRQFPRAERDVILTELSHLFKKYYFSKDRWVKILRKYVNALKKLLYKDYDCELEEIQFVYCQPNGSSQEAVMTLIAEILEDEHDLLISDLGGGDTFVYVDDCSFSGNRIKWDIDSWLGTYSAARCEHLLVCPVCMHTSSRLYVRNCLDDITRRYKCSYYFGSLIHFHNAEVHASDAKAEKYWPRHTDNKHVTQYLEQHVYPFFDERGRPRSLFYRTSIVPGEESVFASSAGREVIEQAFLREGCKIIANVGTHAPSIRPLGFEKLNTLGFGALPIFYRNIPNGTPLALWFNHYKWDGLFERKHPQKEDEFDLEDWL